ncbi:unnamed protein product [Closterium sp. Yama58-4]|nr:unnamed protein product [Closterium sp. Yama58-4]
MTGRRRSPRRDVIVAAGSPALPTPPLAQGGEVPALFRAVADYLYAGVGSAPPARPHQPVSGLSRGYWSDDEVPGTPRDPDVDWWASSWPQGQSGADGDWGTPPPDAPWGEPRPGDGAYQARGMRLSDVGRCVTELSFVLDLLHEAFQSREVVARDPQLGEGQQARARRAVSSALWDILRLPLEPEDPSLDDGPGAAAFHMVATAVEECPLGIVPAIACVLRWLGRRRVERM